MVDHQWVQETADEMARMVADHLEHLGTRLDIRFKQTGSLGLFHTQFWFNHTAGPNAEELAELASQLARCISVKKLVSLPLKLPPYVQSGAIARHNSLCLRFLVDYDIDKDDLMGRFDILYQPEEGK